MYVFYFFGYGVKLFAVDMFAYKFVALLLLFIC